MRFARLKFTSTITNILIHLRIKSRLQSKYSLQSQWQFVGIRCVLDGQVDGLREGISVGTDKLPTEYANQSWWFFVPRTGF